jgi:hypothetical protein
MTLEFTATPDELDEKLLAAIQAQFAGQRVRITVEPLDAGGGPPMPPSAQASPRASGSPDLDDLNAEFDKLFDSRK